MALIGWKPEYSVDITSIDQQHKKLVDFINELHDAMRDGKGADALGKVLRGLVDYTKTHFAAEEKLMKEHGYGDFAAHLDQHKDLLKKVEEIADKFEKTKGSGLTIEVMNFLRDWLTKHILGTDKKYVPHLKAKGVK